MEAAISMTLDKKRWVDLEIDTNIDLNLKI